MKKQTIIIALALLTTILTACGTTTTATPPPAEPTKIPPTVTPIPEIGEIVLDINAELTQETCAGFAPILGREMTAQVSTADGTDAGIGKVEFYIEDELFFTAAEPPFSFSADLKEYEDETKFTLRVDVYDLSGNLHQSDSNKIKVDNSLEPTLKPLSEALGVSLAVQIEGDRNWKIPFNDTPYFETLCQNFNLHIIQFGAFMSNMQPGRDVWDFSRPDKEVAFAEANDLQTRFHPLVWGTNLDWDDPEKDWTPTPLWVHQGDFSREEMIEIMYERIETVMNHYDSIDEWVVVNEALGGYEWGTREMTIKNTVWTQKLGDDYVELAFKYARQVDPDAVLILNEVGVDYIGQGAPYDHRVDHFYQFVVDLLEKDTPIDAVGFQFHLTVGKDDPTVDAIVENFDRYEGLGLDVIISELDISIEEPVTPEELDEQARLYGIVTKACLESQACTSIGVWGHSDKYTWIDQWSPGFTAPCLFDGNMQPKPAYYTVIEVMESQIEK